MGAEACVRKDARNHFIASHRNQTMNESQRIRVSKLDAARRQLDCAIELWFTEKDDVSTHTLAAAAHQIIYDINKKKGGQELLFDSTVIKDERRSEFVALIKKNMNFFKHADQDPEGITEFVPLVLTERHSNRLFQPNISRGFKSLAKRSFSRDSCAPALSFGPRGSLD